MSDQKQRGWLILVLGVVVGAGGALAAAMLARPGRGRVGDDARPLAARARTGAPRAVGAAAPGPAAASATADLAACRTREVAAARAQRTCVDEARSLRAQLEILRAPPDAGETAREAEVRVLRKELDRARASLRGEQEERQTTEGKPIEFPKDLPERYQQPALLRSVGDALRAAGVAGEVKAVDCNEYPC